MADLVLFLGTIAVFVFALRSHHRANFPPDPKHWRSSGLSMTVRDGCVHYKKGNAQ